MQSENYKNSFKDTLTDLLKANEIIYLSIINIAMQGDLKDWNVTIEVGEEFQFDFELFKNSNDVNIKMLVELIEKIDSTYFSIKNINNIK